MVGTPKFYCLKNLAPMGCSRKLQYLNSVEDFEPIRADVDHDKPKYMATFPYPYMNGKLHLGHLYSLSKADFHSYFKKLEGFNVLFPFAFHCTGMPISASAYKLQQELDGKQVDVSVASILRGLGFEDVRPFADPKHWIRTFPQFCIDSLTKFHGSIDWRRSFITTEINKYYDSFVRYQFRKLKRLGALNFGKRYSIFCTIDQQACLDHDRRRGEGLKPIEAVLRKVPMDGETLLIRSKNLYPIEKVVLSRKRKLCSFKHNSRVYLLEEDLYENLKYQVDDAHLIRTVNADELASRSLKIELVDKDIQGKAVVTKPESWAAECQEFFDIMNIRNEQMVVVESENFVKIFEPEGEIISRSGSKCVVSLLDQWYIDYGLKEWKEKAKKCIENMVLTDDTRAKLEESLDWINKWGFSRSFGLGTRIPWDSGYLIDSLSDSTIYNAFYTFKHFMFSDLEGKNEILPSSLLCDEIWEYIFGDIDSIPDNLKSVESILRMCKESFEYFYPVDIRVSGKDLIRNHLLFFIFNHVALFDEKYWPKRIYTNGHLMLNSAKMSKSDGNYLTVEDALARFGASATRMCLADCGDTNEDANFLESTANSMVLRLHTLTKTVESLEDSIRAPNVGALVDKLALAPGRQYDTLVDEIFLQSISRNIRFTLESHQNLVYRDVLKYGFYENLRLIELYSSLKGRNSALVSYGYKTILQLMYPIIPSLSNYLIKLKFGGELRIPETYRTSTDKIEGMEHLRTVCAKVNSLKKNFGEVEISVGGRFCDWKSECMKITDMCKGKAEVVKGVQPVFDKYGVGRGKGMIFCMDYFTSREKYLVDFDEFDVLSTFKGYIEEVCGLKVSVVMNDFSDPLSPNLKFK